MNPPATETFPTPIVHSCVEDGGARRTRSARLSQIIPFDADDTTIPTVLGFSELACAEAPETALEKVGLVETAYRIGSARGRALGAVLRSLAQDAPLDCW